MNAFTMGVELSEYSPGAEPSVDSGRGVECGRDVDCGRGGECGRWRVECSRGVECALQVSMTPLTESPEGCARSSVCRSTRMRSSSVRVVASSSRTSSFFVARPIQTSCTLGAGANAYTNSILTYLISFSLLCYYYLFII